MAFIGSGALAATATTVDSKWKADSKRRKARKRASASCWEFIF